MAASISEGLADIFQVLYDFINSIREATDEKVNGALAVMADDFHNYWSAPLCNVLRALNYLKMNMQ